jgi:hypothetical protein
LIHRIWPIAIINEFSTATPNSGVGGAIVATGESILSLLVGIVMNFVAGNVEAKKSVCGIGGAGGAAEARLSGDSITARIVNLTLRRWGGSNSNNNSIEGGESSASGKLVKLCFGALRSLALPPSPSRGTLAVSGLYPKCIAALGASLRSGNGGSGIRERRGAAWSARAEGCLKLLVNATLDSDGRKAVLGDWSGLGGVISDLVSLDLQGEGLSEILKIQTLMLLRNICLENKHKAAIFSNQGWLDFILDACIGGEERDDEGGGAKRVAAWNCLWIILWRSERAVSVLREDRYLKKILRAEVVGLGGGGGGGAFLAKAIANVQMLMGGVGGRDL